MAIDHQKIRQALRKRLLNVDGLPPKERRAYANLSFTPPTVNTDDPPSQSMWIRETYMPGNDKLVATQQLGAVGIYQIDVFAPKNSGDEPVKALAKLITEAFPPASSVIDADTGISVAIDRSTPLPGVTELIWYRESVQVTFRSYAATT